MEKENKMTVMMAVDKNDTALFFDEAILSLYNQKYLPSEIVIVVDGFVND
jgi:glycosyltransferase involved in cell wall biosynthesis